MTDRSHWGRGAIFGRDKGKRTAPNRNSGGSPKRVHLEETFSAPTENARNVRTVPAVGHGKSGVQYRSENLS